MRTLISKRQLSAWLTVAALAVAGPAAAQTSVAAARSSPEPVTSADPPRAITAPPVAAPGEYVIGPEDVLDITVWKNPDLSRTVPVRPDGRVSLPLVNDVTAAGLTAMQLRAELSRDLGAYVTNPQVSVIVEQVHSHKVSVVGAVKKPGVYELNSQMSVLEALALAGGFGDFADRKNIVVIRRTSLGTERLPFDYSAVADDGTQKNFALQSGDIVVVP